MPQRDVQASQTLQSWGRFQPAPLPEADARADPFAHLQGMDSAIKQIRRVSAPSVVVWMVSISPDS